MNTFSTYVRLRRCDSTASIVFGVPYVLGLSIVSGADFENNSYWLVVPVLGPWIAMGTRESSCDPDYDYDCSDDSAMRTAYVLDGLTQATGAALFIAGIATKRKRLVRQDVAGISFAPARVGTGYGVGAWGRF